MYLPQENVFYQEKKKYLERKISEIIFPFHC